MTITNTAREQRLKEAFFRGGSLTIENPTYRKAVLTLTDALFQDDLVGGDLTATVMGLTATRVSAAVIAREPGVVAGLQEFALLYRGHGIDVVHKMQDGDTIRPSDRLLLVQGEQTKLLALERVGLNLLQRMSGIASASYCLQERVRQGGSKTRIIGTRKTPWGLLDKCALHMGGVGTHRLNLSDAILIKNNHLALLAEHEEDAAPLAIERAWKLRSQSAFIEVEVRNEIAAREAAATFRRLQEEAHEDYPCILMLDNMPPAQIHGVLDMLRHENLWESTLVEASGGITESNAAEYAASGVDAISIGALTHSVRALDICQRMS
jgi:nicotinate-nucleotide pyrophosphorylase (carboxylating)